MKMCGDGGLVGEKPLLTGALAERDHPIYDALFILFLLAAILLFKPVLDKFLGILMLSLASFLVMKRLKGLLLCLLGSTIVSLGWNVFAGGLYAYNLPYAKVLGLSLFPFFAWSLGLFALYVIFLRLAHRFSVIRPVPRLILFASLYWAVLLLFEAVAYHLGGIRNLAARGCSGLPLLNCMHGPEWMKLGYLTLGLVYFFLMSLLGRSGRGFDAMSLGRHGPGVNGKTKVYQKWQ